jgi:hypothetical protein
VTGLPASQQRALNQIEKTLTGDDLRLGPLFAIFTRLAVGEPMPATECLTAPRRRRQVRQMRWMWPTVAALIGLAVTGMIMLSRNPGPSACPATAAASSAHGRPARTGLHPACTVRQTGLLGVPGHPADTRTVRTDD